MQKINRWIDKSKHRVSILVFITLFAIVGVILLLATQAATPSISIEAENGTVTTPATIVDDSYASGSRAILFRNGLPNVLFGLHQDQGYWGSDRATRYARANRFDAETGAKITRSKMAWDWVEPTKGQFDWTRPDYFVNNAKTNGMVPLIILFGSPSWANGSTNRVVIPSDPTAFSNWVKEYASYAAQFASRYKGQTVYYELWNEPNEKFEWQPSQNSAQYITWYKAVYAAMKQSDPGAKISVGGLTGLTASCCQTGVSFLTDIIKSGAPIDYVSIHPYDKNAPDVDVANENDFTDIGVVHNTLENNGRHNIPLWITEWGWPATDTTSEAAQAAYVSKSVQMIRSQYTYVTAATYFMDWDGTTGSLNDGLYRADESAKPSRNAYRDAIK